jgi:hypothetical protein
VEEERVEVFSFRQLVRCIGNLRVKGSNAALSLRSRNFQFSDVVVCYVVLKRNGVKSHNGNLSKWLRIFCVHCTCGNFPAIAAGSRGLESEIKSITCAIALISYIQCLSLSVLTTPSIYFIA